MDVRVHAAYIKLEIRRSPAELVLVYATPHFLSGAFLKEEVVKRKEEPTQ
jgi:hypothetical protein